MKNNNFDNNNSNGTPNGGAPAGSTPEGAKKRTDLPMINDRIRGARLQVITDSGENIGVVGRIQALTMAKEAGLDLVLLSENGSEGVPVVKIMDFGKSQYEKKKKQTEAKKHQKVILIKEIKIRPKIGEHDYETKMNQAVAFLQKGMRVKFTLCFRGRENATKNERGPEIFARIDQTLSSNGLLDDLVREKDSRADTLWSRIYYLKNIK